MAKTGNKKVIRKQVETKLAESFPDIRAKMGDKKFAKRVKKASKILSGGLPLEKPAGKNPA